MFSSAVTSKRTAQPPQPQAYHVVNVSKATAELRHITVQAVQVLLVTFHLVDKVCLPLTDQVLRALTDSLRLCQVPGGTVHNLLRFSRPPLCFLGDVEGTYK